MALPLRDAVATHRVPWVTIALIATCTVVFAFVQPSAFQAPPSDAEVRNVLHEGHDRAVEQLRERNRFAYEWGGVPCEITTGTPVIDEPHDCETAFGTLPEHKSIWVSLVTLMFLHGSTMHLLGNMLFLWVFGNNVEDRLGPWVFLALYLVGGLAATMGFVVMHPHVAEPVLGASGAIAVAMGAYLVLHPRGRVLTVVYSGTFQLVYLPAAVVLGLFFVTQFFTPDADVAWEAHAAGMAFGFLATLGLARLPRVRRRAEQQAVHAELPSWGSF